MIARIGVLAVMALAIGGCTAKPEPKAGRPSDVPTAPPKKVVLDLDKSLPVDLPNDKGSLVPASFSTSDGRSGWVVTIPGGRPIATPAYADGLLFVGGGFGSHEFYAFDAETGKKVWQIKTSDDGPTAAVVEDGCVAFNTESCTVIVTDAKTGRILWEEWLGDPLMSQPAISRGKLYISYPAGQKGHPKNTKEGYGFRLLCADLHTGKHYWEQEIPTDVISAPIIEGDAVYVTCMDGSSFCLDAETGAVRWKKKSAATSAPVISDGIVITAGKAVDSNGTFEGIQLSDAKSGNPKSNAMIARGKADYLKQGAGGGVAMEKGAMKELDASVGFSSAPAAAQMGAAGLNLGVDSVVGGWSYQGSRPVQNGNRVFSAQSTNLNGLTKDGKSGWNATVKGRDLKENQQVFSPPALGAKNLYLCSGMGHLVAIDQRDGSPKFRYRVNETLVFQPTLARGNMYVGTASGRLICLKTGYQDADGWTMWGGNAQHNKVGRSEK